MTEKTEEFLWVHEVNYFDPGAVLKDRSDYHKVLHDNCIQSAGSISEFGHPFAGAITTLPGDGFSQAAHQCRELLDRT